MIKAPSTGLLVLRGLAVATGAALLLLALRPAAHVFDMPMTEDGYYALAVARNLAAGRGLTIDGVLPTNGFQPLFTMVEGLAFWLAGGSDVAALRRVFAFAWLFHVAGALVVAALARDAWPAAPGTDERARRGALAALLYLAAPLMLNHAYNGLETGCALFFYALAWRWVQTGRDDSLLGLAGLGAILGLMVLARIDAGFLAAMLALRELRRGRAAGWPATLGRVALLTAIAVVVSSPWWLYNVVEFGSPMPTSGAAQQLWGVVWLRLESAEWALRVVLFPWLFLGAYETWAAFDMPWPLGEAGYITMTLTGLLRTLALSAIGFGLWRARRSGRFAADLAGAEAESRARARRTLEFAVCLGAAMAGLVLYYTLSFVAYWFYYRYFAPAALFAFVAAPILAARVAMTAGPWPRRCAGGIAGIVAAQAIGLAVLAMSGRGIGGNTVYHDQVALVRERVPAADFVAAGQTGTLGFFRDRVVNLDGKVNREALAHQDRMWEHLRERQVRWFADWPFYVNKYLGVPLDRRDRPVASANGWRFVAERNYFYLYEYVGEPALPR